MSKNGLLLAMALERIQHWDVFHTKRKIEIEKMMDRGCGDASLSQSYHESTGANDLAQHMISFLKQENHE